VPFVYQGLQKPGIVVLLFHQVIDNEQEWSNKYQHRVSDFVKQLDYLSSEGYTTILPSDIHKLAELSNEDRIIILTFDDGTPGHYDIVYPLLRQRNFRGVFFVIASNLDKPYGLSEKQLLEMSQNGMEIGSHSCSHPFLDEMDEDRVYHELFDSKRILSEAIKEEVTSFAPPGGWYNSHVVQIAKDVGYTSFFSCGIGVNDITEPVYIYHRIEVLGDMSLDEFKRLLTPSEILGYKLKQNIKFVIHKLLGSTYYNLLSETYNSNQY